MRDEVYMCPSCGELFFGEEELRRHWELNRSKLEEEYEDFDSYKRMARDEYLKHYYNVGTIEINAVNDDGKMTFKVYVAYKDDYLDRTETSNAEEALEFARRWLVRIIEMFKNKEKPRSRVEELKEDFKRLLGKRIVDVRFDTTDPLKGFDLVFDDGTVLELYFFDEKWAYCISKEGVK